MYMYIYVLGIPIMPNMGAGVMPGGEKMPGTGPGLGTEGGLGGTDGELPDLGNLMEQMHTGQCCVM